METSFNIITPHKSNTHTNIFCCSTLIQLQTTESWSTKDVPTYWTTACYKNVKAWIFTFSIETAFLSINWKALWQDTLITKSVRVFLVIRPILKTRNHILFAKPAFTPKHFKLKTADEVEIILEQKRFSFNVLHTKTNNKAKIHIHYTIFV